MKTLQLLFLFAFLISSSIVLAQRDPVLKQIDIPHNYYFREMYLPQLTSGPSAVSWSPDSQSIVYAMGGSIWTQRLDSKAARQWTDGPGYDYQPDWSTDGRSVVFARYVNDAVSLYLLDLNSGKSTELISDGSVNLEPKWSPDGKKIVYVSTAFNKRFHIFVADIQEGKAQNIRQILPERRTEIYRYYYSPFDHEISPTWSPDGTEIIFITNRDRIYGTGGFWRIKAEPGNEPRQIYYEETTWKARPDWSPDGKRVIYSSYLGRQWHQIWIMTSEGGDPFPLTYGEFDNTAPRWSRDGKKIAFISNIKGNTSLWIQDLPGGKQQEIQIQERQYLNARKNLQLSILDSKGKPTSARVSVTGPDGRTFAPYDSWIHADDSFVRSERPFEAHYFHTAGKSTVPVPDGKYRIDVLKGFEYKFEQLDSEVKGANQEVTVRLKRFDLPESWNSWTSGDLHVHMNYAGTYRNNPQHLKEQGQAEGLNLIYNLIVNKEQRIPDISYFSTKPDPVSDQHFLLSHSQEFHTSLWGHLGVLNLKDHYLLPDYSAYPNTGAASLQPTNTVVADLAHEQGALVGYVHPYDEMPDPSNREARLTHAFPADAALGKADYFEVMGFSDHRASASVWYRLLNCGLRIPAGAGTDAMANYASLRGPVGTTRVYVHSAEPMEIDRWNNSLKAGKTIVTNGPLVHLMLNGKDVGETVKVSSGKQDIQFQVMLRSIVPVDHLELIYNGQVIRTFNLGTDRMSANFDGVVPVEHSGWVVLRAWNDKPAYPILDLYPYATTSPVFVELGNEPVRSPSDAAYFRSWMDRLIEFASDSKDFNTDAEKKDAVKTFEKAREVFEKMQ